MVDAIVLPPTKNYYVFLPQYLIKLDTVAFKFVYKK